MPNRHSFKLNRSGLLLAVISAAFAGQANAAAGRVDFAIGGATVSGTDGRERALTKGIDLDSGDTIKTNDGRAQIRFTDGSYVSLQPNTDFSIKEYSYDGKTDGSERGFFGLAKGAMRAVTGLIGRVNKNRYRITTPTATVGIRGTGGLISVSLDGTTLIQGSSGIWTLTNPAGTIDIPAGTAGLAPSTPTQPPQQTSQGPSVGPAPLQPQNQQDPLGDQKTKPPEVRLADAQIDPACLASPAGCDPKKLLGPATTTTTTTLPPIVPLVSGSGYAAAFGYINSTSDVVGSSTAVTASFDPQGQLTAAIGSGLGNSGGLFSLQSGTQVESGTDGILAWGRWVGTVTLGCDCTNPQIYSANQGLHYVIGMPTPVMPALGTATYAVMGATSPTYADGHAAPGTFSGGLSVDFGQQTITIGMLVNMASDSKGYAVAGTTSYTGSAFSGNASFSGGVQSGPLSVTGTTGSSCTCTCSASVQGFFAGASAERAGLAYRVNDQGIGIVGAAAFKKTP